MNGAHDLGGTHGFGEIDRSEERHFPNEWERKVFAMTLACGMLGRWNLDQSRFARETMTPGRYLNSSYYEHWLHGLERLLIDHELVSECELRGGQSDGDAPLNAVPRNEIEEILRRGGATLLETEVPPLFDVGDAVTVSNFHPESHTRAPRYIRGRSGRVEKYHGAHIFPDEHAKSGRKIPAHLYCMGFDSVELWGNDAEPGSVIFVDVFEPYLKK